MHKFWCCGRPSRSDFLNPEDNHVPIHIAKDPQVNRLNFGGLEQPAEGSSWLAEAAISACTSLAEVAAKGNSASSWPSRLLSQVQTINNSLATSCARLALFAQTSGSTATCVLSASSQGQFAWERPPVAVGWSRTALYDRLAKNHHLQDFHTLIVINRHYDPQHGPDVASLSSHCYGGSHAAGARVASRGTGTGTTSAISSATLKKSLQLRAGDLLALPITINGRVVAALLLGWGTESSDGGGGAGYDCIQRSSGTGGKAVATLNNPSGNSHNHHNHSHAYRPQPAAPEDVVGATAAPAAAAVAALGGDTMILAPSDLQELQRLAQFLGFGLLSDPQQATYLEQVAALLANISHSAATGLHDVVECVLEAIPALLQTKLSLPLQPLLAAVLGNSLPAMVFARRHGGCGALQSTMSASSILGGTHNSRSGQSMGNGAAVLNIGGGTVPKAPPGLGSLGYGSIAGGDSRSGSRKYLGRDTSMHNLAVGTPNGMRSCDFVGCETGSGVAGHGGGGGIDGGGGGDGASRVKAVRTALAYTLLQKILRVGSYSICGGEEAPETVSHGIPITALVIANASSQVLEEEQPGRDVLLAANLTGAGVACLVLCTEAPQVQPLVSGPTGHANGSAWLPHGPLWTGPANAAAAGVGGLEVAWSGVGAAGPIRLSRCGTNIPDSSGGGGGHDSATDGGGSRNLGLAAAVVAAPRAGVGPGGELVLPGGVSCGGGGCNGGGSGGGGGGVGVGSIQMQTGGTLPFRLALYLVSSDPAPAAVLEAVADEMKGLLPLVFGAMHAAIAGGGMATGDFCVLQAQLLQRATTSGTLDLPTPLSTAPNTDRRGPPLTLLPQPHTHTHHPNNSTPRSPGSVLPKSPRTASGSTTSPSAMRRGSIGGVGSASRLRLASPGPLPAPGGGCGGGAGVGAGTTIDSNAALSLSSVSSSGHHDGGVVGGRDERAGAAGTGGGGVRQMPENMEDLIISSSQINNYDVGNSAPTLHPGACGLKRKISAPCYMLSSPLLRLEDVAGPRPLELLVTSARTRITAVAAGSDAGEEARLAVAQDLAAVDLHEVIGSGGQGVVFRGTLHGLETAVKVWEHNGRAPLEHDGEWLSVEVLDGARGSQQHKAADGQQGPGGNGGGNGGGGAGGAEAVVSSRDCIRQAKRGAMEVAVTVTLSHPNVVQPYAHFSDVVVVERQPATAQTLGSVNPGPLQLRLCTHDDPVFRGQKAGPLNTVLCLEYCDAGTLLSAARRGNFRLPDSGPRDGPVWPDLVPLYTSLLEVALALRYLHSRRLVHCDLKPGNVLLKTSTRDPRGWTCKLSDFGCVRLMDEVSREGVPGFRMAQVFGTVAYMAPECFSKGKLLGPGVDIFAFGILMWELLHCKPPHAGIDPKELPRLVARSNVRPEFHPLAPQDYRALASSCWTASPERRPTATQLVSQVQLFLGSAKAAAPAQQQQHRRHQMLQQQQPSRQPYPLAHMHAQQSLQQQQPQQQLQLQQKRQLMRFPSAQSEGRLCDRVVKEQAHQALVQQAQHAQHMAQQVVLSPGGGGSGGGSSGDMARSPSPSQQRHATLAGTLQQQQQPPQRISSLGSCADVAAAAAEVAVAAADCPDFDRERHSCPKQQQRSSASGISGGGRGRRGGGVE